MKSGKVRYLGASSMHAWQFTKALYLADLHGWTRFVSMQNHYNLLYREEEREMMPLCRSEGIGVIPWSPLARGRLARPWQAETHQALRDRPVRQDALRTDRGGRPERRRPRRPGRGEARRSPRPGGAGLAARQARDHRADRRAPRKPSHLEDAVAALSLRLAPEEVASLEEPYVPHAVSGFE